MTGASVLIVEDEPIVAIGLQDRLERLGYRVADIVDTGEAAVAVAVEARPDVVLMDIHLAGEMDGITAADQIRAQTQIPVIYLTAFSDNETVRRASGTEPMNYLHKPCQDRDLRVAVELALYRRAAERERQRVAQRFQATVRSIADALVATDSTGRVTLLNTAAERLTGWTQERAGGLPFPSVVVLAEGQSGAAMPCPVTASLYSGMATAIEPGAVLLTVDGRRLVVEGAVTLVYGANGEPDGSVCVLRDVSERLATAAKLERAEKLESLGLVAGGVAHVMNNLLTVIIWSTDFARGEIPENSPALALLDDVDAAAAGLKRVAEQMLTYAAVQFRQREPLDLSSTVGGCFARLHETAAGRAELETEFASGLPSVTGDEHQLQQAVINLVTNAVEAAEGAGGRVVVRTGSRRMTREDFRGALLGSEEPEGTYVFIEVADNGTGMDTATQKSMFDPFFSTKFTGRGLGLALVHGAVQSHRGAILVSSAPGAGTRVEVLLPAL